MAAYISYIDGTPAINIDYINATEAEKAAARRFNDPVVRADKLPHFPRKTWRDKGYIISYGTSFRRPEPPAPHLGFPTPGGRLLCYTPYRQRHQEMPKSWWIAESRKAMRTFNDELERVSVTDHHFDLPPDHDNNAEEPVAYGTFDEEVGC